MADIAILRRLSRNFPWQRGDGPSPVSFNPHLLPISRGILATIYTKLASPLSQADVQALYEDFWKDSPWVRVMPAGKLPETRNVRGTMFCDVAVTVDERTGRLIITSAIDNLCRGASRSGCGQRQSAVRVAGGNRPQFCSAGPVSSRQSECSGPVLLYDIPV